MKSLAVYMEPIKQLIQPSPGFKKKELSDDHLDICGLCNFGCTYCSSNSGNYLRINRKPFADETERQLGERHLPAEEPALTFLWREVIEKLERELSLKRRRPGAGRVLVFSMQTDGFGPELVKTGETEQALRLVLKWTDYRIRVLTKSATVGLPFWPRFFADYPGRFVVGLSTGTEDDEWARRVEIGTSSPSSRVRATRRLQDAGVPTFGMLCPIFPDMLEGDRVERLVDQVRPELVEHVWAEPFNDRDNWEKVRAGYPPGSAGYQWMTDTFEGRDKAAWSGYATELYVRLRTKATREGWLHKLRYLLYEADITMGDAPSFEGLQGVLLQSKPGDDGKSQNPYLAKYQSAGGAS